MTDEIPRRNRLDLNTPAEQAIRKAMSAVENLGAHPRLSEIVIEPDLLRDKLADYLDAGHCGEPWCKGTPGMACTHPDGAPRPHHSIRIRDCMLQRV